MYTWQFSMWCGFYLPNSEAMLYCKSWSWAMLCECQLQILKLQLCINKPSHTWLVLKLVLCPYTTSELREGWSVNIEELTMKVWNGQTDANRCRRGCFIPCLQIPSHPYPTFPPHAWTGTPHSLRYRSQLYLLSKVVFWWEVEVLMALGLSDFKLVYGTIQACSMIRLFCVHNNNITHAPLLKACPHTP